MRRASRCALVVIAVLVIIEAVPAEDYAALGSLQLRGAAAYVKDSPVVTDPQRRATWVPYSVARIEAVHRLSRPGYTVVLDHAITATAGDLPDAGESAAAGGASPATGTAGTGVPGASTVQLSHELYRGYARFSPTPWAVVSLGRTRLNWGTLWSFSAGDALHPQSPDTEVEVGYDGMGVSLLPNPNVALDGVLAFQDAVRTGDIKDTRSALYASVYAAPVELIAGVVHQYATMLRPGIGLSAPVGPILIGLEGAVEAYDPRARMVDPQPLLAGGAQYGVVAGRLDVTITGEYLYNGLADSYPAAAAPDIAVTRDGAGGFLRPNHSYAAASLKASVAGSFSTGHELIANLNDESYILRHEAALQRLDALEPAIVVTWNVGEAGTEFGNIEEGLIAEFRITSFF